MSERRDFPAWIYITTFLVIVVVALLPILVTVVAVAVAQSYGCQISESQVIPCLINGADYGKTLQETSNAFWLLLFSLPIGFVLFVIWLIVFIIHLVVAGNRRKAAAA